MKRLFYLFVVLSILIFDVRVTFAKDFECPTPKSLMLHSWFGENQMKLLAESLIDGGYKTITYRELYTLWDDGICPQRNHVIVSLDDFYTLYPNQVLQEMIQVFLDFDLVMTIGVITRTETYVQDPLIWDYLKELEKKGFEIASHSANHLNPYEISYEELEEEISLSYEMICNNLGKCPETYILPYGAGYDYYKLLRAANSHGKYRSLVSIAGPFAYSGDLFILKRTSPFRDNIQKTLEGLEKSFPWYSVERNISQLSIAFLEQGRKEVSNKLLHFR